MAEVLSQSEIESLLASMASAEEAAPSPAVEERRAATSVGRAQARPADGRVFLPLHKRRRAAASRTWGGSRLFQQSPVSYETYDFRRPDKLSKDHMRSMQMLHESFSNFFASSLAGYLRTQVQIEVVSVEQVPYEEYMKSISASLLNILTVSNQSGVTVSGQAILEVDYGILFSMLDRLLGGKGASGKIVRDLTDIEKVLVSGIIEQGLSDLKTAWESVAPLEFEVASTETSSQFVQIVPGNDTVVLILLEMTMGEQQGAMSLCIPYLLIKPILHKLSTQRWFTSDRKKTAGNHAGQLAERLNITHVPCVARLGVSALTVADLIYLEIGQVLPMQICPSSDGTELSASQQKGRIGMVDLVIGSHVKFRGKTGLRGRNLAVQIEQIVAPPTELVAHRDQGERLREK